MEFEEIKREVDKIYSNRGVPTLEKTDINAQIYEYPKTLFGQRTKFDGWVTIGLAEKKEIDPNNLLSIYWDFAVDLFRDLKASIGSVKQLLHKREQELKKAYYIETEPLKCLLVDDKYGKKIHEIYSEEHLSLVTDLCYLNIKAFKEKIYENKFILDFFTDPVIIEEVHKKYPIRLLKTREEDYHENQIIEFIDRGKRIVLKQSDILWKLDAIENVLEGTLFNYKTTSFSVPKRWDEMDKEDQEELKRELSNEFKFSKPHKDEIYRWFGEIKNALQVKPAFYKLKEELENEGLKPEEYGLKEEPEHFNRAYNKWLKREQEK